ncbi:cupredoxin domain-containing protein [Pediococcus acidilactici]
MKEQMQVVDVTVAGGYQPAEVHFQEGVPAQINFRRTSPQGCLDVVHSPQLGFEEQLPLDETKSVTVNTDHAGEFSFSCGMDMFSGKVVIE